MGEVERRADALEHHRAAAGLRLFDVRQRLPHVLRRRGQRLARDICSACPANCTIWNVSSGRMCVSAYRIASFDCSIGCAVHAPRHVEREHHLQRPRRQAAEVLRRDEHQREVALPLLVLLRDQARLRRVRRPPCSAGRNPCSARCRPRRARPSPAAGASVFTFTWWFRLSICSTAHAGVEVHRQRDVVAAAVLRPEVLHFRLLPATRRRCPARPRRRRRSCPAG